MPTVAAERSAAHSLDRILIKPAAESSEIQLLQFHTEQGTRVLRRFNSGTQVIGLPPGAAVSNVIDSYRRSGLVQFAEPNHFVARAAQPDDPYFAAGLQWSLMNTGVLNDVPLADIGAVQGWEYQHSASNIIVAILDTGIRYTHEDLAPNLWVNTNDGSFGFNAFAMTNDPADDDGHGTQIAGIIGAVGNNGKGITGVAWHLQMMACKTLDNNGVGTDESIVASLEFARTNGARIVNASFSGMNFSESVSNELAILRESGIIVVAAAGNDWCDVDTLPTYPACYDLDNIVSVGFTDDEDFLGFRSNFGLTNVDLMAPGSPPSLFSVSIAADDAYEPANEVNAGTSYAAAHVTGALALILERFPNEDYQTSLRRLMLAVDKVPQLEGTCVTGGRLNLVRAFNPPIEISVVAVTDESFELQVVTSPNREIVIESSLDLFNWSPIHTNSTSNLGTFHFVDNAVTNSTQQFYRVATLP